MKSSKFTQLPIIVIKFVFQMQIWLCGTTLLDISDISDLFRPNDQFKIDKFEKNVDIVISRKFSKIFQKYSAKENFPTCDDLIRHMGRVR